MSISPVISIFPVAGITGISLAPRSFFYCLTVMLKYLWNHNGFMFYVNMKEFVTVKVRFYSFQEIHGKLTANFLCVSAYP
jgi:hypothetical protein